MGIVLRILVEVPDYKKQHYLPVCYLKNFSLQPELGRRAPIWRFDGKTTREVPVDSQCREDYFYSKSRASLAERFFQSSEKLFVHFLSVVASGRIPSKADYYGLLLSLFDMHIRTEAYENATGREELDAYKMRALGIKRVLVGRVESPPDPSDDEIISSLQRNWRVGILPNLSEVELFTSTHPSILWGERRKGETVNAVILPLKPNLLAIGYNRNFVRIEGNRVTTADALSLNRLQCHNASAAIFSARELKYSAAQAVREELELRRQVRATTSLDGWDMGALKFPITALSFLRPGAIVL